MGAGVLLTTFLDLVGLGLVAGFAFFVFPPLPLLVVGLACLWVSRKRVSG